jgi:hypothetical protein
MANIALTAVKPFEKNDAAQIRRWQARRVNMVNMMGRYVPPQLKSEFAQKRKEIKLDAKAEMLGTYKEYVQNSIASTCLFLYGKGWLDKARQVANKMDWERIKADADTISDIREGMKGEALSKGYVAAVAALADVMEQETGVDRKALLALAMQETRGNHNWYNPKTGNLGIMQLTGSSPLFTYVSAERPDRVREIELRNVMRRVLPEKRDFGKARAMMSALYYSIRRIDRKQGDLAMNMLAGALTYGYKYCVNSKTDVKYPADEKPAAIGIHLESVKDYNGTRIKGHYADSVFEFHAQFGMAFAQKTKDERLAVVPKKGIQRLE